LELFKHNDFLTPPHSLSATIYATIVSTACIGLRLYV